MEKTPNPKQDNDNSYYNHLDTQKAKNLAILIGNMAHEMRNTCQGYANPRFPPIQALDNQHGQIEGQARQI